MRRLRERIGGALGLGLLMVLVWVTIWWNQGIVYEDVLPVLPHSVAWPILKKTRSAVDLLPRFVGGVASENVNVMWKGACFYQNEAHLEYVEASGEGKREGLVLHIKTSKAHSYTCLDLYVFATPYRVTWDYYFLARNHTLSIKELEEGELEYIKKNGISVFLMPAGMLGTLVALYDALPIFFNSEWGENANIAFLKKHMGAQFIKRSDPWVTNVTTDDIQSGDFLALSKIRGRWGGFETLEKWVSGSYSGHTAVCLRDDDGKLWVGESGHENEKVASAITVWTRLQPDYASNMWNEALNKRLGTKGLDLPGVMVETERQGIPFEELLAIPEKDNWKYSDGYSTSCVAFVLEIYKQAGLFGSVADSVQVTEFTVRDAYMLKFYEDDKSRLPAWCGTSNTSRTYCQILGEYDMELPGYNTIEPYANMNERCPSLPPSYDRPAQC